MASFHMTKTALHLLKQYESDKTLKKENSRLEPWMIAQAFYLYGDLKESRPFPDIGDFVQTKTLKGKVSRIKHRRQDVYFRIYVKLEDSWVPTNRLFMCKRSECQIIQLENVNEKITLDFSSKMTCRVFLDKKKWWILSLLRDIDTLHWVLTTYLEYDTHKLCLYLSLDQIHRKKRVLAEVECCHCSRTGKHENHWKNVGILCYTCYNKFYHSYRILRLEYMCKRSKEDLDELEDEDLSVGVLDTHDENPTWRGIAATIYCSPVFE